MTKDQSTAADEALARSAVEFGLSCFGFALAMMSSGMSAAATSLDAIGSGREAGRRRKALAPTSKPGELAFAMPSFAGFDWSGQNPWRSQDVSGPAYFGYLTNPFSFTAAAAPSYWTTPPWLASLPMGWASQWPFGAMGWTPYGSRPSVDLARICDPFGLGRLWLKAGAPNGLTSAFMAPPTYPVEVPMAVPFASFRTTGGHATAQFSGPANLVLAAALAWPFVVGLFQLMPLAFRSTPMMGV